MCRCMRAWCVWKVQQRYHGCKVSACVLCVLCCTVRFCIGMKWGN
ncbi:hypothetical protein HMPREF3190_00248 [Umbribacter vaginalis]|nr:hypothetical protein HMPREF3190_00248 [Coriobacteriales bacterium DNF00809]